MAPRLRVAPFTTEGDATAWVVRWRVSNAGEQSVQLLTAIQPHSQFRSPLAAIAKDLEAGASLEIALPVRFGEAPGSVIENPFLILRVREAGADWRVLARVRVSAGSGGEPIASGTVVVTTQRMTPATGG